MRQKAIFTFMLATGLAFTQVKAQTNIATQLGTISNNFSSYVDGYMEDLTSHQGFAFLNNLNSTGRVLGQWELSFSLKTGTGLQSSEYGFSDFSDNFSLEGGVPTLFGTQSPGKMTFCFLDEETGLPLVNPFTGENLSFGLPLLPGMGTSLGVSPAILPVFSLGIGYGTEVSVGLLPGVIRLATKGLVDGFSMKRDIIASVGARHDVSHWIPWMHDHNFGFSLGLQYSLLNIGATIGSDLIGNLDTPSSDKFEVTNNLTGLEYRSSSVGFEALLTRKFGFLDLTLFSSFNQTHYRLFNQGGLDVKVAKSFYSTISEGFDLYQINDLINIDHRVKQFLYGIALQFNLGRFNLALKAAPFSGQHYYSVGLGFKILKK